MNSLVASELPLHETQTLRDPLMQALTDRDLAYALPEDDPTLGELCRPIGELEHSYIQSFPTLHQDWSYRNSEPDLASSVARLTTWYTTLDDAFDTVLRNLLEQELHRTQIDRRQGVTVSAPDQFQIYREALLLF